MSRFENISVEKQTGAETGRGGETGILEKR
jgi:hypothetical protein